MGWLSACSDFLEETSQNGVRPSQVTDLEQILLGDGYMTVNPYYETEIFTDNIGYNGILDDSQQSLYEMDKWRYMWDENMFDEESGLEDVTMWYSFYAGILGCNLVLDYLDEMEGDDNLRENLRGEALALRSWYYFHLVNLFGVAYNQGDPRTELAVPLKLHADVEVGSYLRQNTVAEIYEQIENDLKQAAGLLEAHPEDRTYFRAGHLMAKALLSRIYLYKEDWDQAIAYADSVLMEKPDLVNFNKAYDGTAAGIVYNENTPDEIIWVRDYGMGYDWFLIGEPFGLSLEAGGMYGGTLLTGIGNDVRGIWVIGAFVQDGIVKGESDFGGCHGIRTAELYLNRAEAYAQKYLAEGDESYRAKALDDLNNLRKHRIKEEAYADVNLTDGQELLDFVIEERRRELIGESCHRWCDVRRYGMTVRHTLEDEGFDEERDMSRYVLPIPQLVLDENPMLQRNIESK